MSKPAPLNAVLRQEALTLVRQYKRQQAEQYVEHAADCAYYRLAGYTPHYCIHGTNRWTDYDNICFMCEEFGDSLDPQEPYYRAIAEVREKARRRGVVLEAIIALHKEHAITQDEMTSIYARVYQEN